MRKLLAFLCILLLLMPMPVCANWETMDAILASKKSAYSTGGNLLDTDFVKLAGTPEGDWFVIAMKTAGYTDNYDRYLDFLKIYVEEKYKTKEKLHRVKATEWHRIILAVLSAGGNPADLSAERKIDLVNDGIYNRALTAPLDRQGLNGYIWALLALDAAKVPPPPSAADTRESIVHSILSAQNKDGSFPLAGNDSDTDITAMAVQALAPYASAPNVNTSISRALSFLSSAQGHTGGMRTQGTETAETTAQTVLALCALGIDPKQDARFIKNGNTLLDGLYSFCNPDGTVKHAATSGTDDMAAQQVFLALAAYNRLPKTPKPTPTPKSSPPPTITPSPPKTEVTTQAVEKEREVPEQAKTIPLSCLLLPGAVALIYLLLKRKK